MQPHQFTLYHFLHEYNQNRDLIEAYLKGESIEGFQAETDEKDKKDRRIGFVEDDLGTAPSV